MASTKMVGPQFATARPEYNVAGTNQLIGQASSENIGTQSMLNFKLPGMDNTGPSLLRGTSSLQLGGENLGDNPFSIQDPAKVPDVAGSWTDKGKFGLGVAKVGLGVYSALEQAKMNKFMRGYYGDQMDLQKADFSNMAKSTNEAMAARQQRISSAHGNAYDSEANKASVASHMDTWGVQENI
ncbi:MAG: hypothetical protein DRH26_01060 [Deltaproteobacteria bacterium]|nr:MAG: hypothetical protein DRH26_01060 [Deltaproteobacteria bacterium]